jgi:ketosteroid isomerase-like protein
VESFRFLDLRIYPMADPEAAAAEIRAEALIKMTGRTYRQEYVVFLRCKAGKITHLREYFDPVRAAKARDAPISDSPDGTQISTETVPVGGCR